MATPAPGPVAVNAAIVSRRPSGLGVVARETALGLSRLSPRVVLFGGDAALFPGARVETLPAWTTAGGGLGLGGLPRFFWTQAALPWRLRRLGAAKLLSPNHELLLLCPCPQVVVMHDLLPLLYPDEYPRQRRFYRHILPRALARAETIIAVSQNTKNDLVSRYGLDPQRIRVIHSGVDARFRPGAGAPPARPYILSVGSRYPHKNLPRLLEAFASLASRGLPHELVLAGSEEGGRAGELERRARELGCAERVRFAGVVAPEDLPALYARADLFVLPSLYEGFGLPALEAMASGCPVAAARVASLPEVCGDAAEYFDPADAGALSSCLAGLLGDPARRASLRDAGLARARSFTWEKTARAYAEVLGLETAA